MKGISKCRICGNKELVPVIDLGEQYLTGVFPKTHGQKVTSGPLELVKCMSQTGKGCGLLQLKHSFDPDEMYGDNYGYRSGINKTMTIHLHDKVRDILSRVALEAGDIVVDVGSNDSTLLKAYPLSPKVSLIGFDPSGEKFLKYYPERVRLVADYFSAKAFHAVFGGKKARVVTSIAMFYDLEYPLDFMRDITSILARDGIWVFEQSYMPLMLKQNAYDTICHEHLEYYGLRQIQWMAEKVGLKILDVRLNDTNGGSFSVTAALSDAPYKINSRSVNGILQKEKALGLETLKPYREFKSRVLRLREELIDFVDQAKKNRRTIIGYGASTKGNVVLQFCGFTHNDISAIAERNPEKYGCFTPGTRIPIISEKAARAVNPDYFLVLPWHFRDEFIKREKSFLGHGGGLMFPLPKLEVVKR